MSTTWEPPAPPLQTVWWVLAETTAGVLHKLRLAGTDIDKPRIELLVPAAGWQINERLDRTTALSAGQIAALKPQLENLVIALYLPPVRNTDGTWLDPIDTISLTGKQRRGVA